MNSGMGILLTPRNWKLTSQQGQQNQLMEGRSSWKVVP